MAVQKSQQFWGTETAEQPGEAESWCDEDRGLCFFYALLLKSPLAPKLWYVLSPLPETAVQIADEKEEKNYLHLFSGCWKLQFVSYWST